VARANVLASSATLPPVSALDSRAFNIGTSVETDVVQLAGALKKLSGASSAIQHAPARPGEQLRSAIANDKAGRMLGWRPGVALDDGLRLTYDWFKHRRTEART
jgi:UDP-glucose 4-epimerase